MKLIKSLSLPFPPSIFSVLDSICWLEVFLFIPIIKAVPPDVNTLYTSLNALKGSLKFLRGAVQIMKSNMLSGNGISATLPCRNSTSSTCASFTFLRAISKVFANI